MKGAEQGWVIGKMDPRTTPDGAGDGRLGYDLSYRKIKPNPEDPGYPGNSR